MGSTKQRKALITGAAGFIGYHTSKRLLDSGWRVIGLDCMSDYYDVALKKSRESVLLDYSSYRSVHGRVETPNLMMALFSDEKPDVVIHLAAQAGVRNSIDNPRDYLESNVVGTFELLEASRAYPPKHVLLASTSSVYGANEDVPFSENMKADHQMSFYAATKKSTEVMAHSYAHLFNLPMTMFRFFTVYGPWGRPDMALFSFTKAILERKPIQVYNFGDMNRDFTYIDDLVEGIVLLIDNAPNVSTELAQDQFNSNSGSLVAPYRIVNIGNSNPINLIDFISAIEHSTGIKAKKTMLPMQAGDVQSTWADTTLLTRLTGYKPRMDVSSGVRRFVDWYRDYYRV